MATTRQSRNRRGGALVMVCLLLALFFVAAAFSIDIARVQLTQIELQAAADAGARAGAEAIARGVGDPDNLLAAEAAIRAEIEMVTNLNTTLGQQLSLDSVGGVEFGRATGTGTIVFQPTATGGFDNMANAVRVRPEVSSLRMLFGSITGLSSVSPSQQSAAMVQQRDIVVVLDKSGSMFDRDAGLIPVTDYVDELRSIEEDLFAPGDAHYDQTRFEETSGYYSLTRRQALKLALFHFRKEVDESRGDEQLGLVSYATAADDPFSALDSPSTIDLESPIGGALRDALLDDSPANLVDGALLEPEASGYANFDFNFIKMRGEGSTHIAHGIDRGVEVLFGPGRREHATPVLIVMTDGNHMESGSPEESATNAMAAHPNLYIYTITFGAGANQTAMQAVAETGRGEHHHATDVNTLVSAFRELARTSGVTLIE